MRTEDRRLAMARHEAAHAIVAQAMGLTVAWVSIEHGLEEGIRFQAAVKIPDDTLDMERDRLAVCVAMAAPSFVTTYDEDVDRYARLEADLAYQIAGRNGIDPETVYDEAAWFTGERYPEIMDLGETLFTKGKVVFQTV